MKLFVNYGYLSYSEWPFFKLAVVTLSEFVAWNASKPTMGPLGYCTIPSGVHQLGQINDFADFLGSATPAVSSAGSVHIHLLPHHPPHEFRWQNRALKMDGTDRTSPTSLVLSQPQLLTHPQIKSTSIPNPRENLQETIGPPSWSPLYGSFLKWGYPQSSS